MIQLSKENQAKLQEKMTSREGDSLSESPQETTVESPSLIDPTTWTSADQAEVYDLQDFIPYRANQLKIDQSGTKEYVEYLDDSQKTLQVRQLQGDQVTNQLYRWNDQSIEHYGQVVPEVPLTNYLKEALEGNQLDQAEVVLQAPLQVGQTWQRTANQQSQIVSLYDQIQIAGQDYQQAIEVVTQEEGGDLHEVYVAQLGCVAAWQEATNPIRLLKSVKDDVMFVYQAPTYIPKTSDPTTGPMLESERVARTWQTNDSLAQSFQRLFQDQAWIGPDIQVLDVSLNQQGIATVSFSPGVVASFSQHPAGEYAVIAAIVQNVADHFKVQQVQVLVQGNWMLTTTFPAPPASTYQVDPNWLQASEQTEADVMTEELILGP